MDWRKMAACQGMDPELWFPLGDGAPAKTVCARCPVAADCLLWSFEIGATDGIFGGMDADDRRALRLAERG